MEIIKRYIELCCFKILNCKVMHLTCDCKSIVQEETAEFKSINHYSQDGTQHTLGSLQPGSLFSNLLQVTILSETVERWQMKSKYIVHCIVGYSSTYPENIWHPKKQSKEGRKRKDKYNCPFNYYFPIVTNPSFQNAVILQKQLMVRSCD